MTGELRRYWLEVLPHISDEDCRRLEQLLDQEVPARRGEIRFEPAQS